MSTGFVSVAYVVASVLFILSLWPYCIALLA